METLFDCTARHVVCDGTLCVFRSVCGSCVFVFAKQKHQSNDETIAILVSLITKHCTNNRTADNLYRELCVINNKM